MVSVHDQVFVYNYSFHRLHPAAVEVQTVVDLEVALAVDAAFAPVFIQLPHSLAEYREAGHVLR